jgi:hypothetical protein
VTDGFGPEGSVTISFIGYTTPDRAEAARAFEDEVLALLPAHGAKVVARGHRRVGQDEALPIEVHTLWFPSRAAFEGYLGDPARAEMLDRHGEVFDAKIMVEVEPIP